MTGASSGIGKDFAHRLINEGYLVYGAARRTDRMGGIKAAGGHVIALDVTDDTSILACVTQILSEQQRIDVLINNAGYGQYGALEDVPIDEGRRQMETNLLGPARLTQLILPHMRERSFGKIINISSIGGKCSSPLGGWYHASKFALEGYSDALRNEVRPFGIDVVVIEPGGVVSEWSAVAAKNAEPAAKSVSDQRHRRYAHRHHRRYGYYRTAYWQPFPIYFPHVYHSRLVWNRVPWF